MKTQKEYMEKLNQMFTSQIIANRRIFDAYSHSDSRARDYIKNFKDSVEELGLTFSKCYHANGIGNNNEYNIVLETVDNDGFIIQKNIAELYYCYGIYGGCSVRLMDLATKQKLWISCAR